jgi:hypothetical protein
MLAFGKTGWFNCNIKVALSIDVPLLSSEAHVNASLCFGVQWGAG